MDDGSGLVGPGRRSWWAGAAAAAIGAGVVLAVHYGRGWAEGTCAPSGDCLGVDASLNRDVLLVAAVIAGSLLLLFAARIRRAWLVAPIAFAAQGWCMLVVEHADGFWLPLWLDLIIGAAAWCAAAVLVSRR